MATKLLVVEDDPAARRLVSYALEQEGYEVLTASNGLEGLTKAQTERPELLVLDVMLPGLDGFEVCHKLRSDPQTAGVLVLMLSAKAQESDKNTGLKMGADDYLAKPADPLEVAARVRSLLQQKAADPVQTTSHAG
jgi:DNA-binding response OmpR family regulator